MENFTELLQLVKESWNVLYEIVVKQVNFMRVVDFGFMVLFVVYFVWYINLAYKVYKYSKYTGFGDREYNKTLSILKDSDSGFWWFISGLVTFGMFLIFIANFITMINFVINPDYLVYNTIYNMILGGLK